MNSNNSYIKNELQNTKKNSIVQKLIKNYNKQVDIITQENDTIST